MKTGNAFWITSDNLTTDEIAENRENREFCFLCGFLFCKTTLNTALKIISLEGVRNGIIHMI